MALVKGIKLVNLRLFVLDRFGASAWARVTQGLEPELRRALETADAVGWDPLALHTRINQALWENFDDASCLLMRELGRFEADRELSTVNRWFLPLIDPGFAIRHMDLYWRRSNDTGHWVSQRQGPRLTATLEGWGAVHLPSCHRVLGYLGRVLELFGGRIGPLEHPACRANGHPACVFRTELEFPVEPSRRGYRVTLEDVPAIGRELAQYPEGDALADALLALFHTHLGYQRVALWGLADPQSPMQLLCAAGLAEGAGARRFILEQGGRVVGQLELGAPRVPLGPGDLQILEELLPWIAVVVQRLASASPGSGNQGVPVALSERQERARRRWQLTPRQSEVLGLVVCGRTNREISEALGCREGTVEMHVHGLLDKCGAENRAMLTALFWSEL